MPGPIAIIGAGSWGTALGILLSKRGFDVRMRDPDPLVAARLQEERENANFLSGFSFPPSLRVMYDIEAAAEGARFVLLAVPSQVMREVVRGIPVGTGREAVWVVTSKGLEEGTGCRMTEVVAQERPRDRVAVLAGPSLAREVASGLPTSVLSSSTDRETAEEVRSLFHGSSFRVYTSDDPIGVETGTALKNVVALAAGISEGMELGANTLGALLTRGLAEITRLGTAMGARRETFLGLAGVGDLVTTCSSPLSRNRSLGFAIGRGVPVADATRQMAQIAEGVPTTRSAVQLGRRLGVELPIAEQVHRVLFDGLDPHEALRALMGRPPREEGG